MGSSAPFCAKCGRSLSIRRSNGKPIAITVAVILGLYILGSISRTTNQSVSNTSSATSSPSPPERTVQIDKSAEKQKARVKLIQEMKTRGFVSQIKFPGPTPELWARPAFFALDFDTKQQIANVVYAYYCTGKDDDMVLIYNDLTGKKIGYFMASGGLKLDD
jgi:hypothetical protein